MASTSRLSQSLPHTIRNDTLHDTIPLIPSDPHDSADEAPPNDPHYSVSINDSTSASSKTASGLQLNPDHHGDFARLIPVNRQARSAFHQVADNLMRDSSLRCHIRQYIHIESSKQEADAELSSSDTDTGNRDQQLLWTGYYRFNLGIPPSDPRFGWFMGSGRKELGERSVDLLLTEDRKRYSVSGRHARITHHSKSDALLLIVDRDRPVWLEGKDEIRKNQQVLWRFDTGITIGDLTYRLAFTNLDRDEYRKQLLDYRKLTSTPLYDCPVSLEPTPSTNHYEYKDYIVKTPFAGGTFSTVCAGVHKQSGDPVAIKKMKRTPRNLEKVGFEVKVHKALGSHPRICHLVEVFFSGGNEYEAGPTNVDEVYLITSPLATLTFNDVLLLNDLSDLAGEVLWKQCVEGVGFLHARGLMHRDLKPENVAIVSLSPPRAILLDLGSATWDEKSFDHTAGTIVYLAPEVMELKNNKRGEGRQPYDKSVDIWGLAILGYQLFCQRQYWWRSAIDRPIYAKMWTELTAKSKRPIIGLVQRMFQWQALHRPSAADVLADPLLQNVDTGLESKEKSSGKRARDE